MKAYGWTEAIGKRIPGKKFKDHEIIGVVKDFNFASLYTKMLPTGDGIENTLDQLKVTWEKITGNGEFTFAFVDQTLADQYRSDQSLAKIIFIASVLAILIGSFGVYGLASLAMQNRIREMTYEKLWAPPSDRCCCSFLKIMFC